MTEILGWEKQSAEVRPERESSKTATRNGNREDLWKGRLKKHFWHLLHLNKCQILYVFPLRVLIALQLSPLFASVFQKPQGSLKGVRDCYQIS